MNQDGSLDVSLVRLDRSLIAPYTALYPSQIPWVWMSMLLLLVAAGLVVWHIYDFEVENLRVATRSSPTRVKGYHRFADRSSTLFNGGDSETVNTLDSCFTTCSNNEDCAGFTASAILATGQSKCNYNTSTNTPMLQLLLPQEVGGTTDVYLKSGVTYRDIVGTYQFKVSTGYQ